MHEAEPSAIDLEETNKMEPQEALSTAFDAAEKHLGVPQLLETSDFLGEAPTDDKSVILYVAKLKQAADEKEAQRAAAEAQAAADAASAVERELIEAEAARARTAIIIGIT